MDPSAIRGPAPAPAGQVAPQSRPAAFNASRSGRRTGLSLLLVLGFWSIPNNEAAWWHDRIYDGCMLILDDDRDWVCETRLPAIDP